MAAASKHSDPSEESDPSATPSLDPALDESPNYTNSQQLHVPEVDTTLSSDMPPYNNYQYAHAGHYNNNSAYGGHQQTNYSQHAEPYHGSYYTPATWSETQLSQSYGHTSLSGSTSDIAAIPNHHARPAYSSSYPPSSYPTSSTSTSYPSTNYQASWTSSPHSMQNTHELPSSYPSSPSYTSPNYVPPDPSYQFAHASHSSGAYRRSSSAHNSAPGSTGMLSPYSTGSMSLSSPRGTPPTDVGYHPSSGGEEESNSLLLSRSTVSGSPESQSRQLYSHSKQSQLFKDALALPFAPTAGPFIPQSMYKPHTNSDRRRYVEEVDLDEPIYFWMENPNECGISLSDALHSRVKRLLNRDQTVFEGRGPSVSIRLEWPGYRQWSRQIPTKDFRTPPGPITRAKLAKNVAKCVQRFIVERQNHALEDETDVCWRVGSGTAPNYIRLEDLVLVSIHHVSMGSWQPQLRLNRTLPT